MAESKVSLSNPLQASFPRGGQLVRAYLGMGGWCGGGGGRQELTLVGHQTPSA